MNANFQLLVLVNGLNSSNKQSIEIGGMKWTLTEPTGIPDEIGDYICLSYASGEVTMPHPFSPSEAISARTLYRY